MWRPGHIGLAAAVLINATIVRAVLLPAGLETLNTVLPVVRLTRQRTSEWPR
jgi:hypothetical protein